MKIVQFTDTSLQLSLKALILVFCAVVVVRSDSSVEQQNEFTSSGVRGQGGGKAKKIQIVYIKVPLSKVLQNPSDGYNNDDRGFNEGNGGGGGGSGGGQGYGVKGGPSGGIPGEGRVPTFGTNNIGGGGGSGYGGGYGDNYGASNQNSYDSVQSSGQEGYGQQKLMFGSQEANAGYGNKEPVNYGHNDGNLGMAYGAAVGNALPQNQNYDESANYGQESQNSGYAHTNQINYDQNNNNNNGYQQNPVYNRPQQNDGYGSDGYGADNYDNGKNRGKGNQHYPKMMANFRPQMPIMSAMPSFSMKGFSNPSFGSSFPSFGGQSFPTMGGMSGVSGISGIGGLTGGMKGFGGIKSKLSLLLGNKFGMGGAGGLLGGMMGWD